MCHVQPSDAQPRSLSFRSTAGERGSALVIALLVVVILALLGLSFMLAGETESKIARNQRDAAQAGFVAEGGVRVVKKWFDAPGGPNKFFRFPTTSQMNRSLRGVDDDNNGTYVPYLTAADPAYRVQYRQDTNDPFEKPYRGSPKLALLGDEANPDIRISESGSTGEHDFLNLLNDDLYPGFPDDERHLRARIRQIDVYSPPILLIGGERTRYGIATVKVIADVYQYVGSADQTRIATRIVKAVLNEAPYLIGLGGPLQSCQDISTNGDFGVHWGMTTAFRTLDVHSNLNNKVDSSVPYKPGPSFSFILPDLDGNGTTWASKTSPFSGDDLDHDGTLDFKNWLDSPNVNDPWSRFMSEGNVTSGGSEIQGGPDQWPGCSTDNCQPAPFYNPNNNRLGGGDDDHSNIFKKVTRSLCPDYDYAFWKGVALGGGENVYYFKYDSAGKFRLFGDPNAQLMTADQAVNSKNGFFFFDTTTSTVPVDTNSDGTFDNLTPEVSLPSNTMTGGFIYLNANMRTTGGGNPTGQRQLIAPGEPFNDTNGNRKYDLDEWFIDITYPNAIGNSYVKNGAHQYSTDTSVVRQDPAVDAGTAGKWNSDINMYGVLYTNGALEAQGNWIFFGTVITRSGMRLGGGSGNPDFYWDERLVKDQWPPFELNLPRTVITAWQTGL